MRRWRRRSRGGRRGDGFDGVLVELDVTSLAVTRHRVVRRPQCAGCGDPGLVAARAGRPVVLASRPRVFGDDGGYRVVSPDETWDRLRHHVSPVTGVVASLGPLAAQYDEDCGRCCGRRRCVRGIRGRGGVSAVVDGQGADGGAVPGERVV
ncbi:MAG: TOMM precursor leader peptide-binding protein [bacterium]